MALARLHLVATIVLAQFASMQLLLVAAASSSFVCSQQYYSVTLHTPVIDLPACLLTFQLLGSQTS